MIVFLPKRFLFALASLVAAGAAALAAAQAPTASLTIEADKPLHAVSPMLYGLMTEEINYSYDGGLYAEMVRNRTFQEHGFGGIAHWNLENKGNASSTMAFDGFEGPSDALQGSLALTIKSADATNMAGVRNEGYWGMALKPETTYKGSFYAKADAEGFGPVKVSLVNDATGKVQASATVNGLTSGWKQYEFTLKTGNIAATADNHLLLEFGHTGTVWLDLVSLFPPTYKDRANGNRIDLMEMQAAMHPKFLRMPGGNYLEGDDIDQRFDWKTTLGPLVDRPGHQGPWRYRSSDGMGLLEFLEWTEDLKIEPVLAVYAGYSLKGDHISAGPSLQPFVDDALDEIEFVMGDTNTKWGAVRAKLGHPAPFPLHYVEVGNEDWLDRSGSYEYRYPPFYKAIKAKYPQLQVIATAPVKHGKADVVDDHYYKRADEFFDFVHHYDNVDRNGPKIFVGEWATREGSPTTNLGAALGDAAWMTAMERNSDLIVMSAYAPMLVNVNPGGMQWESDLIGFDASKAYGSPGYWAQVMFAEHLGTEVPASAMSGGSTRFFYSVTKDAGKVYLKLVNGSSDAQPVQIALNGVKASGKATLVTLSGTNPASTNTIEDMKHIVPVTSSVEASGSFQHTMPPYSVQVLALSIK